MAGPLAAAAAAEKASKTLTGDIVVIRGQTFREVKEKVVAGTTPKGRPSVRTVTHLVPIELEAHVNAVSLGLGALAVGAAALAAIIAWNGVAFPGPFGPIQLFPGIKDTAVGDALSTAFTETLAERQRKREEEARRAEEERRRREEERFRGERI